MKETIDLFHSSLIQQHRKGDGRYFRNVQSVLGILLCPHSCRLLLRSRLGI